LFVWLVADGWCWFVLREEYCWLVADGWFVLREKYCWLVADKPSEQSNNGSRAFFFQIPSAMHACTFTTLLGCPQWWYSKFIQ
jgi:hypothetical protein